MKEHWGVSALHDRVFSHPMIGFEPPRASDCAVVVVSGVLGSTQCEELSPVLVVTELREPVFQLERPT